MRTSTDRILTTHVGSLPRTEAVVALLEQRESGASPNRNFNEVMENAVADVV